MRRSLCITSLLLIPCLLSAQSPGHPPSPAERYRSAQQTLDAHSPYPFVHDDSPAAIVALRELWSASIDAAIAQLQKNPNATAQELNSVLCRLDAACNQAPGQSGQTEAFIQKQVLPLAPHLFVIAQSYEETGSVFIVGPRNGKPGLLWTIASAQPQPLDRKGLIAAWRPNRAGDRCRTQDSHRPPGACGPLYASLGLLPPDAQGRPRFYINAGYAQGMGATVSHQSSIWRWNGDKPELLWINLYEFMIDQKGSDNFANGILSFEEKHEFHTFYACGSCEGRQMLHRLHITPTGVEDLGLISITPELDLVDELFTRLSRRKPTAGIADPKVTALLQPQIPSGDFSAGMLDSSAITRSGATEHLCFIADSDIGRIDFTLALQDGHPSRITRAVQASGPFQECGQPATSTSEAIAR